MVWHHLRLSGEVNLERGPLAWSAGDGYGTAMTRNNAVDHRQPHAGALSLWLRRKVRLEDTLENLRSHTRPSIPDREPAVGPRLEVRMGRCQGSIHIYRL